MHYVDFRDMVPIEVMLGETEGDASELRSLNTFFEYGFGALSQLYRTLFCYNTKMK